MLTCDAAQRSLSALADGEAPDAPADAVHAHLEGCATCRGFETSLRDVRQLLRFEAVGDVPDLAPAVLARLPERRRWWPSVAAAALVGAVAGATFAGAGHEPATVAAADLAERVVDVQPAVTTLSAGIEVEAGGQAWTGTLRYRAPESLAVVLRDEAGTLLATVADADRWWVAGPRRCAPPAASPCAPAVLRAIEGRAPFAEDAPVPLELVSPVDALARSAPPEDLGTRTVAGVPAIGVLVTAGQVAGLLDGLDPTGALRPVHPSDPVDLWLDEEHLVPVEAVVRAASTPERARWAAGLGLDDEPGATVLSVRLGDLEIDGALPADAFPPAPAGAPTDNAGFVTGAAGVAPEPTDLPVGLEPGRSGTIGKASAGTVGVRTWSDGRAWLAVRATTTWEGDRLYGNLGAAVVPVDLGSAGVGYASADRTRIALHGWGIDVVVSGSIGPAALRQVAASLGIDGIGVPANWAESATATLAEATRAAPDLLLPGELDGFGAPAIRVAGGEVAATYAGAGDRSFVVVRGAASELPPPLDPDVTAIEVRGHPGRWRAATGDLEWVEAGHARALRSATVPLAELLAIAETLHRP